MSMRLDTTKLQCVKRGMGGKITARCPVCAADGKDKSGQHLSILPDGRFNCIVGSAEDRSHNYQIRQFLRGTAPDDNPDDEYIEPPVTIKVDKVYDESTIARLLPDYSYWLGRGAKAEVIKKLEGGLAPLDERSKLSNRFVFPIRGLDGRISGFTGRLTEPNSFAPSWKHCFRSGQAVHPWIVNGPAIKASKTVVLVESVGDLISLMSNDINNVLCIFGLNLNGKIIATLISAGVNRIIISLNRDEDPTKGQAAADKIRGRLGAFFAEESIVVRLPPEGSKDWGVCPPEGIEAFRQEINS